MPREIEEFRRGKPIPAWALEELRKAVVKVLIGGRGIRTRNLGNRILIDYIGQPMIPHTTGNVRIHFAANKAALDAIIGEASAGDFGYTTDFLFRRGYQLINGSWLCYTHLE